MFKKYYKDANNDIKADEAFINSVIENARKKRVPSRKSYFKYALTAAAAVVVLSATAVTMPLLTDNNDDGVISVVTQTAQPGPHSPQNTAVPNPSETVKETTKKAITEKETKSDKQAQATAEPIFRAAKDTPEIKQEAVDDTAEAGIEVNGTTMFSCATAKIPSEETVTADMADSIESKQEDTASTTDKGLNSSHKVGGGGGGSTVKGGGGGGSFAGGSLAAPNMKIAVLPPSGYRISEISDGRYVFVSDNGAVITVITEDTTDADTEPVYDGVNVSFITHGMKFTIISDGAEKAAIDEIVNSLR